MAKQKTPPKKLEKTVRCPNCEGTAPTFENSKGGRFWKCENCKCWGGLKRDGKPTQAQTGATEGKQNPNPEKPENGGGNDGTPTGGNGGGKSVPWWKREFTI